MFSLRNDPSRRKAHTDSDASQSAQTETRIGSRLLAIGRVGDLFDDRAFRPIIPMAVAGEVLQRRRHFLYRRNLALQFGYVFQRHRFDVRAVPGPIAPKRKQVLDLLDREAEIAGAPHELQRVNVVVAVNPIAGRRPKRRADQPDLFVIADIFDETPLTFEAWPIFLYSRVHPFNSGVRPSRTP